MMSKVLGLALCHLKQKIKQPGWWLAAMVLPILMMFLLGAGFAGFFEEGVWLDPFDVILVNEDDHTIMQLTQQQILNDEALSRLVTISLAQTEAQGYELMEEQQAAALVLIPEGMIRTLEAGDNKELLLVLDPAQPFEGQLVKTIMEHSMKSVSGGQSAVYAVWNYYEKLGFSQAQREEKIVPVMEEITFRAYRIRNQLLEPLVIEDMRGFGPIQYYGTAMLVLFLLFLAVAESREWLRERATGITQRILLSGMSTWQYMGVQFFRVFFAAILQSLVMAGFLWHLLSAEASMLIWFVGLYVSFLVLLSSLSLLVGVCIQQEETYQTSLTGILLISALVGGGLIPLHYLPDFLRPFSWLTPHYWMLTASFQFQLGNVSDVQKMALGFCLLGGAMVFLAGRLFRNKQEVEAS